MSYDHWKATDPGAEFLGEAELGGKDEEVDELPPAAMRQGKDKRFLCADDFVLLCDTARECVVRVGEISALEAEGNYTRVYMVKGGAVMVRRLLGACLEQLDPKVFVRLGREAAVNLGCVTEIRRADSRRWVFVIKDGAKFVSSKKRTVEIRRQFSL